MPTWSKASIRKVDSWKGQGRIAKPGGLLSLKPLVGPDGWPLRNKKGRVKRSNSELVPNPATRFVGSLTEHELTSMTGLDPDQSGIQGADPEGL